MVSLVVGLVSMVLLVVGLVSMVALVAGSVSMVELVVGLVSMVELVVLAVGDVVSSQVTECKWIRIPHGHTSFNDTYHTYCVVYLKCLCILQLTISCSNAEKEQWLVER